MYKRQELSTSPTLNNVSGAPGQTSTIDLIVTDADGCTHSTSLIVEWVEDIQFNLISPNSPPCAGTDVVIEVDPVDPLINYNWNTGATGESIVAQNAGIYTATGINANGCFHSASFEILPPPDLCTVPSGCHEDCYAQLVCAPEGHGSYQWYQDGVAVPGADEPCFLINSTGLFWVEVTGLNGCTSTSKLLDFTLLDCTCDFEPIVEVDDECCVTLSFDNNSTGCFYELSVHTHGEPATFDVSSDFNLINSGPAAIQLEYIGGVAPIGIVQDAVEICFLDPQATPIQNIGWDWANPDEDKTCGGEFPVQCDSDSSCVTIVEDALICQEDGSLVYNFTLCNSASTTFDIGYFSLSAVGPPGVTLDNTTFDLSGNSLAPGSCGDFSVLVQGANATDELCLFFSVHEENPAQNPAATCCFLDVCMEVPECGCAEVEIFDVTCTADGYALELGIVNHLLFDFGQIQLTYPGQYGPIVQWVTGVSLGAQMSSTLSVTLDPDALAESPFCIDMVFYQAGNAGEWLECCHIQVCTDLPFCGEISGCTDPDAINFNPNATVDDGSCLWDTCILPTLINPNHPCNDEYDPVCGCNGMTYGNSCYAMYLGGVVSWTQGECEDNGGQGAPDECPTDINADGTTNVVDLLLLLGEFASPCE